MNVLKPCQRFWVMAALAVTASATPVHLRCEYRKNPVGIDAAPPHLSWQSNNTERNWKQGAYEILVASSLPNLHAREPDVWDSGKIASDGSVDMPYGGPALKSKTRYYWKVRVWDAAGRVSESTEDAWWETGLLDPSDWKAKWIAWKNPDDEADRKDIRWIWTKGQDALAVPARAKARFRVNVPISDKPASASLFLSVRGDYVARVNGNEVGSKSRWEAFDRRDIADFLKIGDNAVEVEVTAPESPDEGLNAGAKTTTAALAALIKVTMPDGAVTRLPSGEGWEATPENGSAWQGAAIVAELGDKRLGDSGPLPRPAAMVRRTFVLPKQVSGARLFITALGSYRAYLNGSSVGDDVLTPGFTDYRKRVLYQTYDVTGLLKRGKNQIGILLGDGWYGSPLTWDGIHFFEPPDRFEAQLELDFVDGTHSVIVTDDAWKASASALIESEIYAGETYDARQEKSGWKNTDFDDSEWSPAEVVASPSITVSSQPDSPPRVIRTLDPTRVTSLPGGVHIFDMGQNMVGWVTLKVKGSRGTKVRMRFAEILNPDGTLYTANLRSADATDTYILKGGPEETFAPHFTFHGFRYVELTGYPGIPPRNAIQGEVVSSVNGEPAAKLTTASELVNRMWNIGLWGQRGNFLSVPTDCPQRDERLGWMGDAGVFWRTGTYNFDVAAFSQKFIQDIADAQTSQGAFSNVSPNVLPSSREQAEGASQLNEDMIGAPGWGDAGIIVPWTTWVQYRDTGAIAKNWESMQRWMDFIQRHNPDFIRRNELGPNYADWLAPDQNTNKELLATAYWALMANMMAQMGHAIGKDADARRHEQVMQNIRVAFQKAYIQPDGTVGTGTQTSYVVALYAGMAPKTLEPALVDKLVSDIERRNGHLSTGFLGTPFLLFVLADHGRSDVAYRLLLNVTYPSWGYMLSKGATTWWERWNGDTGDPEMNSYNHYAFGSVMAWVYRYAAGIDATPEDPGFKEIVIHPRLDSRMPWARAEYASVYGKIVSEGKVTPQGTFSLSVTIPANTSARIILPVAAGTHLTESGKAVQPQLENGELSVRVGSGIYSFEQRR